jgi:hypothetical protein
VFQQPINSNTGVLSVELHDAAIEWLLEEVVHTVLADI